MNQSTKSAPAPDGAVKSKESALSDPSIEPSASHYNRPEEPRVSVWIVAGVVVALLAVAFFVFKFAHR